MLLYRSHDFDAMREPIMQQKTCIKSMSHEDLETLITSWGYPKFRVKQVEHWLYAQGVSSFDEMTNLPKNLRADLAENTSLSYVSEVTKQESSDGTRKYLLELPDGARVETVGIPSGKGKKLTVCFSTQAGCAMGCVFCATGRGGFLRNLTCGEMFDQVKHVEKDFGYRVSNIVAMGQGEPFANYDQTLAALRLFNSPTGLGIGARHITVSTCGLIGGIDKFTCEPEQFTLAVSLHSAIQETRDQLMPGVKKFDLVALKESLKVYGDMTKRRPSLEYAPIAGVNDDDEHIEALIEFCNGMLSHVNLIPLNPISEKQKEEGLLEPSPRIKQFESVLQGRGVEVSIRTSRGADIDGACGQLSQQHI